MREKYECICRDAFANNKEFQRTIKSAFEHFLNKGSRSAQFLCQYVDTMLKKTIKGMSEDEVESKLTKIIGIFRYLQDKDIFERFYKDYLSKRLLSGRTVSDDAERRMIGKLKTECGYQFTQQLEGMFTDIKNSHQVAESFLSSKYYDRDSGDVDFSVKVLTGGFWSAPPESECSLPPLIEDLMARFRKFYLEGHSGRRISLQCSMGTGSVQATFGGKRKELVVTTYQMCILMLFNEKETQTMAELQAATGISRHELKRHVVSLTLPKYRILKKENKDTFSVNKGFKSKQFRIRIPLVTMRSSTREYAVPKKVLEDRRHAIEAAIVRVMKTRQTLSHNELIGEVTRQLSSRFSPNTSHIKKKRIESLIERESTWSATAMTERSTPTWHSGRWRV